MATGANGKAIAQGPNSTYSEGIVQSVKENNGYLIAAQNSPGITVQTAPKRHLSSTQRQSLVDGLRKQPGQKVQIYYAPRNSEIDGYADEIKSALTEAGWYYHDAEKQPVMPLQSPGIRVFVHDDKNAPLGANILMLGLIAAEQKPLGQKHNLVETNDAIGLFFGYQ